MNTACPCIEKKLHTVYDNNNKDTCNNIIQISDNSWNYVCVLKTQVSAFQYWLQTNLLEVFIDVFVSQGLHTAVWVFDPRICTYEVITTTAVVSNKCLQMFLLTDLHCPTQPSPVPSAHFSPVLLSPCPLLTHPPTSCPQPSPCWLWPWLCHPDLHLVPGDLKRSNLQGLYLKFELHCCLFVLHENIIKPQAIHIYLFKLFACEFIEMGSLIRIGLSVLGMLLYINVKMSRSQHRDLASP